MPSGQFTHKKGKDCGKNTQTSLETEEKDSKKQRPPSPQKMEKGEQKATPSSSSSQKSYFMKTAPVLPCRRDRRPQSDQMKESLPSNTGKSWAREEDHLILHPQEVKDTEIAKQLKRTVDEIQKRRFTLLQERRTPPPRLQIAM